MYFNLSIAQKGIADNFPELNIKHGAILNWFDHVYGAPGMQTLIHEQKMFTWIDYGYVRTENPLLKFSCDDSVYRYFRKLVEVGLLEAHPDNSKMRMSFYAKGEKWNLLQRGEAPEHRKGEPAEVTGKISGDRPEKNPGYHSIIDHNSKREVSGKLPLEVEQELDPDERKLLERLQGKSATRFKEHILEAVKAFREETGRDRTKPWTKDTVKYLVHWLKQGYSTEDLKLVIKFKTDQFTRMNKPENMNIETYFRYEKFESNLQNAKEWQDRQEGKRKELYDTELSERAQKLFKSYQEFMKSQAADLYEAGHILKASQFLEIYGARFLSDWRIQYPTYPHFRRAIENTIMQINAKRWEWKKDGFNLFQHIKQKIRSQAGMAAA